MTRRVLLVDDDKPVLLTLKAVLELNGFEVDTAASGTEAREKLKAQEYDVVITDIRMETEDGGAGCAAAGARAEESSRDCGTHRLPAGRRKLAGRKLGVIAGEANRDTATGAATRSAAGQASTHFHPSAANPLRRARKSSGETPGKAGESSAFLESIQAGGLSPGRPPACSDPQRLRRLLPLPLLLKTFAAENRPSPALA